jgi:type IV secretory pathway VirB10-like protein
MELNIAKFDPLKAEVTKLVENIKNTVIVQPGDITGYELMKENKKVLQKKRVDITKDLKSEREGALAFQKAIIATEKELLAIIEPVENELDEKINAIDEIERREQRKALLPERLEKCKSIELEVTEELLLSLDEKSFATMFVELQNKYLLEKQAKIDAENKRIADEKLAEEQKKKHEEDIKKAAEEAGKKAKEETEAKAAKEKQDLIDEQNRKEKQRLLDEAKAKKDEADRIAAEKAEQEKMEKQKKYKKFLADNDYNETTDLLDRKDNKIILYRKVGEFIK